MSTKNLLSAAAPWIAALALAQNTASAIAAAPAGPPPRKTGWWELTTQINMPQPMTQTMHFCTDPATEARMSAFSAGMQNQGDCTQGPVVRTASGWNFSSTCRAGGTTTTIAGTATGDFQSDYRVNVTMKMEPAPAPQMAQSQMVMTARWVGACPAGRKPGDMVLGNGMVVNGN
jgi:hypothetical protein